MADSGSAAAADAVVIVINWRRYDLTRACLHAVLAQSTTFSVDVVLVDNESDPVQLASLAAELPGVRTVPQTANLGFAAGVMAGVRASTAAVIVLVNNDAIPDPGFLQHGVDRLRGSDDIGAVAATLVHDGAYLPVQGGAADGFTDAYGVTWVASDSIDAVSLVNSTGVSVDRRGNGRDRDWLVPLDSLADSGDPFGFSGGGAFLRRTAVDAVGGFDPALFMYYEDLDVSWRMRLAGYRIVWERQSVARHRFAASSGQGSSLVRVQSMRNRLLVALADGSPSLIAAVIVATAVRRVKDLVRPGGAQLDSREWRRALRGPLRRPRSRASARVRRQVERRWFGHG